MRSVVAGVALGSQQFFAPAPAYVQQMTYQQTYGSPGYVQLQGGAEYPVAYVVAFLDGEGRRAYADVAVTSAATTSAVNFAKRARTDGSAASSVLDGLARLAVDVVAADVTATSA